MPNVPAAHGRISPYWSGGSSLNEQPPLPGTDSCISTISNKITD